MYSSIYTVHRGLLQKKIIPRLLLKKTTREECQIFIQNFFKIVLYWCFDLIRHNIGTHLKHNKYIFDISIPFCLRLYLSATLKQCFTEFAVSGNVFHHVYMSVRGRIPTCDLIGRLFLGSGLKIKTLHCPFSNWNVSQIASHRLTKLHEFFLSASIYLTNHQYLQHFDFLDKPKYLYNLVHGNLKKTTTNI